jgi:hypothetical protein
MILEALGYLEPFPFDRLVRYEDFSQARIPV